MGRYRDAMEQELRLQGYSERLPRSGTCRSPRYSSHDGRRALFTDSDVGNAWATSGSRTTAMARPVGDSAQGLGRDAL